MATEDFTTYTEVDTGDDRIQRTATHIDHNAWRDEDTYLYDDKGAGHFTDFTGSNAHLVDVKLVDAADNGALGCVYALTNDLDDMYGLRTASKTTVWVNTFRSTSILWNLQLREEYGGTGYADTWDGVALDTWYYLKIEKSGTSLTCKIYPTDSDRTNNTNILDTLTLTLQADHSFRYVFGCNTFNSASALSLNNDVENLDLQEAVGGLSIPVAMHHYRNLRET